MSSNIQRRESQGTSATSTPEIEFALVLSRMIDSVRNDPAQLRDTVYELARQKLQEQFAHEDVEQLASLTNALEAAIQGVEVFSRKNDKTLALPSPAAYREIPPAHGQVPDWIAPARRLRPVLEAYESASNAETARSALRFTTPWRFLTVLAIALAVGFAFTQRGITVDSLRKNANLLMAFPASVQPKSAPVAGSQAAIAERGPPAPKPSPLVPTSYGVYAVSAEQLYELELLPGRAPDIRIAVSPAITTPSRATLPDGHLRFIVFRRDSASSAAERADVRLIAKIERAMSFDKAGKPIISKADDAWVIRNISIPYRTAPNKDNPDMYDVVSETPEMALSPGRYAMVLKGQAYDFTVAGLVTDARQCLEQLAATNGAFYSECQKP